MFSRLALFARAYAVVEPYLTPVLAWAREETIKRLAQEAEARFPGLGTKTGPEKKAWVLERLHASLDAFMGGDVPFLDEDQEFALVALLFGPVVEWAIARGWQQPRED